MKMKQWQKFLIVILLLGWNFWFLGNEIQVNAKDPPLGVTYKIARINALTPHDPIKRGSDP